MKSIPEWIKAAMAAGARDASEFAEWAVYLEEVYSDVEVMTESEAEQVFAEAERWWASRRGA